MNNYHGKVDTLGLSFFGNMTASISHEIKNALAIINENAGLLGDLVALTEKGRPLEPERLKTISENIRRRVQNADDIVRRLNRFANSVHGPVITTGIREVIESTIALSGRLATMKGITIAIEPDDTIQAETIPFILGNMLWVCLKNIYQQSEENQHIDIVIQNVETDIVVSLRFSSDIAVEQVKTMIAAEGQPLIFFLRMQVDADNQNRQLHLRMPQKFID
jgi:C4-dicarboxylate-specific signal transduction histidine kinase